jgi:transcriptional regulator with XRE-family HTH domain
LSFIYFNGSFTNSADLDQLGLAELTGLTQQQISGWITGYCSPSLASLKKIAEAADKPLSYFIDQSVSGNEVKGNAVVGALGNHNGGKININTQEAYRDKLVKRLDG